MTAAWRRTFVEPPQRFYLRPQRARCCQRAAAGARGFTALLPTLVCASTKFLSTLHPASQTSRPFNRARPCPAAMAMQVGRITGRRAARIQHHDPGTARFARRRQALPENGMAPGSVRTHQYGEIADFEVLVTHGHHVFAESTFVPRHRGRHAQARIGVDVGDAEVALHELVGDVVILGEQLARDIERHGVRPVLLHATAKFARDLRGRCIPTQAFYNRATDTAAGLPARWCPRVHCPLRTACHDWQDAPDHRAPRPHPCGQWPARRSRRRSRDR